MNVADETECKDGVGQKDIADMMRQRTSECSF